jgi:hypothetical protein
VRDGVRLIAVFQKVAKEPIIFEAKNLKSLILVLRSKDLLVILLPKDDSNLFIICHFYKGKLF